MHQRAIIFFIMSCILVNSESLPLNTSDENLNKFAARDDVSDYKGNSDQRLFFISKLITLERSCVLHFLVYVNIYLIYLFQKT